jgi:hypothetical protein
VLRTVLLAVFLSLACVTSAVAGPFSSNKPVVIGRAGDWSAREVHALQQAALAWNTLIGRPVLLVVDHPAKVDLWISPVLGYEEPGTLAVTHLNLEPQQITYLGVLKVKPRLLLAVFIHELGHALGLGHSENKKSIMYPQAEENGPLLPDAKDIDQVRELWN